MEIRDDLALLELDGEISKGMSQEMTMILYIEESIVTVKKIPTCLHITG